ncbi:hypothetical protein FF1_019263 [Malus domestica]|uniref:Uncharacterized protein n=1 Tax=Malus domestica TaxID=3750 RepID=A0A498I0C3_MALDO|nr:hypothetical protein DVH24_039391 [Malus domestica]
MKGRKDSNIPTTKKQIKSNLKYVPRQASTNTQSKPPRPPPPLPPYPTSGWSQWMDGITKAESKEEKDKIDAYTHYALYAPKKQYAVSDPKKISRLPTFENIAP